MEAGQTLILNLQINISSFLVSVIVALSHLGEVNAFYTKYRTVPLRLNRHQKEEGYILFLR